MRSVRKPRLSFWDVSMDSWGSASALFQSINIGISQGRTATNCSSLSSAVRIRRFPDDSDLAWKSKPRAMTEIGSSGRKQPKARPAPGKSKVVRSRNGAVRQCFEIYLLQALFTGFVQLIGHSPTKRAISPELTSDRSGPCSRSEERRV